MRGDVTRRRRVGGRGVYAAGGARSSAASEGLVGGSGPGRGRAMSACHSCAAAARLLGSTLPSARRGNRPDPPLLSALPGSFALPRGARPSSPRRCGGCQRRRCRAIRAGAAPCLPSALLEEVQGCGELREAGCRWRRSVLAWRKACPAGERREARASPARGLQPSAPVRLSPRAVPLLLCAALPAFQ